MKNMKLFNSEYPIARATTKKVIPLTRANATINRTTCSISMARVVSMEIEWKQGGGVDERMNELVSEVMQHLQASGNR